MKLPKLFVIVILSLLLAGCALFGLTPNKGSRPNSESTEISQPLPSSGIGEQNAGSSQPTMSYVQPTIGQQPANTQQPPVSTSGIEPPPSSTQAQNPPPSNTSLTGAYTLLEGKCFDFNSLASVPCANSSADIIYLRVVVVQNPTHYQLLYKNGFELSGSFSAAPDLATCTSATYYTQDYGLETGSLGRYFCYKAGGGMQTSEFGWLQPASYDDNRLTFNACALGTGLSGGSVTAMPIPQVQSPVIMITNAQQVLASGTCYDLHTGQVASCDTAAADLQYEGSAKQLVDVGRILWPIGVDDSVPTEEHCESINPNVSTDEFPIWSDWPLPDIYICISLPASNAVVKKGTADTLGWIRITSYNSSQVVFDYLIWNE